MTVQAFYRLLKDIVKYYPAGANHYDRLNTFAVIQFPSDVNTPNLGKNQDYVYSDYFYSRLMAQAPEGAPVAFSYPLLTCLPIGNSSDYEGGNRITKRFSLAITYPDVTVKPDACLACPALKIEEIENRMQEHAITVMNAIRTASAFAVDGDVWLSHESILDQYTTITSYSLKKDETKRFRNGFSKIIAFNFVNNYGAALLSGVQFEVEFVECFEVAAPVFSTQTDSRCC